jgi:hypothetical protein
MKILIAIIYLTGLYIVLLTPSLIEFISVKNRLKVLKNLNLSKEEKTKDTLT